MFIDLLYDHLDNPGAVHVIWSDGPSSESKNRFMVKFFQSHSQKHQTAFLWKYFAKSHGKGVEQLLKKTENSACSYDVTYMF